NVELVFQVDQARHRVWRRTVHADLPVVIHRHEGEGRIDPAVDDGQVQAVHVGNRLPVGDARSTHRVHADVQPCPGDGLHVHHRAEVAHIGQHVVIFVRGARPERTLPGDALHGAQPVAQNLVGAVLDGARGGRIRRAAARRVVLEAAVARRVVRRGDYYAVGQAGGAPAIVRQDGV